MKNGITTDFHAHILPRADHGSDSVETSLKQLGIISSYGIKRVVATPHFYPESDNVDMFLERRAECAEDLKRALRPGDPEVILGAEVLICNGIERMEGLNRLAVTGTNCILLEMPMTKWSDVTYDTIESISRMGLVPVMAHIDRYDPKKIEELMRLDVLAQLNPDPFLSHKGRKFAERWLETGKVVAVGSDIHMASERTYKNFSSACESLGKYAGHVERSMQRLLEGARPLAEADINTSETT